VTDDERQAGDIVKVAELMREIRVALLTTVDREGHFHTRPVQTLQVERGEVVWFFTGWSSPKVDELLRDRRVSLGYADPGRHVYLAVSGLASLLRDPKKARELWTAEQRAYYPDGPDDKRLALLRVQVEHAEYWMAPGRMGYLIAAAKATLTGNPAEVIGEDHKVR
jgi:general stress protein 26